MSETPILARLGGGHLLGIVSGTTMVPATLLMEEEEFSALMETATSVEELVDWVNENF
jgi:hypothetical protein